jgi:hypothetical protein
VGRVLQQQRLAVVMVLLIIVPLAIFNKYQAESQDVRK